MQTQRSRGSEKGIPEPWSWCSTAGCLGASSALTGGPCLWWVRWSDWQAEGRDEIQAGRPGEIGSQCRESPPISYAECQPCGRRQSLSAGIRKEGSSFAGGGIGNRNEGIEGKAPSPSVWSWRRVQVQHPAGKEQRLTR